MNQLAMKFTRNDRPVLAGSGDATSAHVAASELIRSGQHATRCLEALRDLAAWDGPPPTAMELARGNHGRRDFYARRLFDCRRRGWVTVAGERACAITGNRQQVWQVTAAGRAALAGAV